MSVRVFAPAKINLTLEVGAPHRASGRHPLQSVVVFADVGDWITVERDPNDVTLHLDGPFFSTLIETGENLVLDAVGAIASVSDTWGAALTLTKNLPVAAGMGGGSSDAAATLKALNEWWLMNLNEQQLMEIGRPLGGDVPVCVFARSAYMTGEGEIIAPMALPPLDAVLVNPGVAVATASVFHQFDAEAGGANFMARPAPEWASLDDVCKGLAERGNMLEAAARVVAPVIAEVAGVLRSDPRALAVGLSGSGATMFAICANAAAASALAASLSRDHPDWWVTQTRLALP